MSIDHRVNFENREMYERVKYLSRDRDRYLTDILCLIKIFC